MRIQAQINIREFQIAELVADEQEEMRRERDMNKNKVEHLKEENTELKEHLRCDVIKLFKYIKS